MHCSYCGNDINQPFIGRNECDNDNNTNDGHIHDTNNNELYFCDILCGRLYDIIVSPIIPYMDSYNKQYILNEIAPYARMLYERLNEYGSFKQIPICTINDSPVKTKQYYKKQLGIG